MDDQTRKRDILMTRRFDAPIELVWKAWTDAEHVKRWWGPKFFTFPFCKMNFREGGTTLVCTRTPDGKDMYNTWTYQKVVPLERIEYIQNLSDQDGNPIDPVAAGVSPDFPGDVRTVVTFKTIGDQTEITITEYGFPDSQIYEFAVIGLEQCMDKMALWDLPWRGVNVG